MHIGWYMQTDAFCNDVFQLQGIQRKLCRLLHRAVQGAAPVQHVLWLPGSQILAAQTEKAGVCSETQTTARRRRQEENMRADGEGQVIKREGSRTLGVLSIYSGF